MSDIHVVILAAGKGTRMKSAVPKVLHRVAGIPMLDYVLKTAAALKPQSVTAVVGHKADALDESPCGSAGIAVCGSGTTARHCARPSHRAACTCDRYRNTAGPVGRRAASDGANPERSL